MTVSCSRWHKVIEIILTLTRKVCVVRAAAEEARLSDEVI